MGMFDDVWCEAPLPDGKPGEPFQTKDFPDPYLEKYVIRADGLLTKDNQIIDYHGYLHFYGGGKLWREFRAKFTDGRLVEIIVWPPVATPSGDEGEG